MNSNDIKKQNAELKRLLELEDQQDALETPESIGNDIKNDKAKTIRAKSDFINKISGEFGEEMMKNPNAAKKIEYSGWEKFKRAIIKFFKSF